MNQTQVNNFLRCLMHIDDSNYLNLHARAAPIVGGNAVNKTFTLSPIDGDILSPAATVGFDQQQQQQQQQRHGDHDHDHDDSHNHDLDDGLLVAKVTAMVVLFAASSLCGSIPFVLNRFFKWTENNTNARSAIIVKCLLYFGGGVLLCTTFLHLLPEVQEVVEQLQECEIIPHLSFALAELLMCAGFFFMYFIEETIHAYLHRSKGSHQKDDDASAAFERGHSVRNSFLVKSGRKSNASSEQFDGIVHSKALPELTENDQTTARPSAHSLSLSVRDLITNDKEIGKQLESPEITNCHQEHYHCRQHNDLQNLHHQHHHDHHHYHNHHNDHQHQHHHHHHSHIPTGDGSNNDDNVITSSIRGLFIVLALSLHELFEGMAIGLEGSASDVWFMFGAVSAHKLVLAFCVGVELIVARTRLSLAVAYIFTFAVVSPLGIGIGILISNSSGNSSGPSLISAILQGLACGTLLYVVFFEILSKNHSGLGAYLALFIGFAIMFGLQRLGADGHGHSHGSCGNSADGGGGHSHSINSPLLSHEHRSDDMPMYKEKNFEEQLHILRQAAEKLRN